MLFAARRVKRSSVRPFSQSVIRQAIERLEDRTFFAATVTSAIPSQFGAPGGTATVVDLTQFVSDPSNESTVEMVLPTGTIQIQTFDQEVPINAGNFLKYVHNHLYDNATFQRVVENFVMQGGAEYADGTPVPNLGEINSEANGTRHNTRGTLAFARVGPENGGGPNSATNQFFFNLADNSANLDAQNGGFTVFGEVQGAGMTVVDQTAALPNETDRVITSARVIPDMTYTVTSSDPSAVSTSVDADGFLSLNFTDSNSTATITVTGTDLSNNTVQTSFTAQAGQPISVGGSSGNKSVTFTQSDGTVTTVSAKGAGTATVILNGTGLTQSTSRGRVVVTGTAAVASLDVTGSDAKTSVAISTKGGTGVSNIGALTVDGPIKSISGKGAQLTGAASLAGPISSLVLASTTGSAISIGGTASDKGATISIGTMTDTSITATEPIRSLKVNTAVNSDSTADNITGAGITSISSKGDFGATVNLTGESNLKSMKVGGNLTANITAHQIGSISVKGDATGVLINATHGASEVVTAGGNPDSKSNQAMQSLKVGGTISGSTISSGGTFGSISAGGITGSLVVSGAPNIASVPAAASDIPEPGSVLSFKVKDFASSFVIGKKVGKVSLGTISINNGGSQFGVYADTIGSVTGKTNGTPPQGIKLKNPADQSVVDAALTGVTLGDFKIVNLA
jgi:cyclophilin family peptidyl-prolyl cis-trans isomerase